MYQAIFVHCQIFYCRYAHCMYVYDIMVLLKLITFVYYSGMMHMGVSSCHCMSTGSGIDGYIKSGVHD